MRESCPPAIDPELLDAAFGIGGMPTKTQTVSVAPEDFVARRDRARIVDLLGAVDWDDDFGCEAAQGPGTRRRPDSAARRRHRLADELSWMAEALAPGFAG